MFGNDDDDKKPDDLAAVTPTVSADSSDNQGPGSKTDDVTNIGVSTPAVDSAADSDGGSAATASSPVPPDDAPAEDDTTSNSSEVPDLTPVAPDDDSSDTSTDTSAENDNSQSKNDLDSSKTDDTSSMPNDTNQSNDTTTNSSSLNTSSVSTTDEDDLLAIKKEALQDLSPLVDKLDQSPDEKFRTTMMMIQASDDKTLIKRAYDAAKNISDEKERAQALLDIVNEINYFTQPHNN